MSLLTDPSYLIYQMRLALINNDQTAKKIVTLPIYSEDDYLVYSNSPEDNTYSSSPNITMMGSDLYQSKKSKSPFSPFLSTPTVRSQHQLQPSQQSSKMFKNSTKSSQTSNNNLQPPQKNDSGKNFSQNDSKIKVDAEQDRTNPNNNNNNSSSSNNNNNNNNSNNNNLNNASTLINKNLNSHTDTNTSYITSTNKPTDSMMMDDTNTTNNHNNNADSTSCRSTNSLQLEDEEDAEYNDSLSSSNDSSKDKEKEPVEAPVITENLFVKQKNLLTLDNGRFVPRNKPLVSNLSQLLKQNNSSSNPFSDYRFL
ncbi:hypothetical protein PIROE2DRAFT_12801, partial [Piromyces sp. E2]